MCRRCGWLLLSTPSRRWIPLSITEKYKSLRDTQKSWAAHVARSVHVFYAEVVEYLHDHHEDWIMDSYYEDRSNMVVGMHLFGLQELERARKWTNHPTMQLHEMIVQNEPAAFAEAFKAWWDANGSDRKADDATWKLIRKNTHEIQEEDFDVLISYWVMDHFPDWLVMDKASFDTAWAQGSEALDARKRAMTSRISWS